MPARPQRCSHLLLPLRLSRPHLPPSPRILKSSLLMLRLRHNLGYSQLMPFTIHRNKCQIRRRDMPQPLLPHILHHHPNPNFHRSPKRPVHTCLQYQQLPEPHRCHKIQMIHARRNRKCSRMSARRHRRHQIDVLHQTPAKQIANRIRICRQYNLASFRLGLRNLPCQNLIVHIYKSKSRALSARSCQPSSSEARAVAGS